MAREPATVKYRTVVRQFEEPRVYPYEREAVQMRALWERFQSNVEFGLPQGQSACTRGENAARVRNLRQRVSASILFEIARRVQARDKVSTSGWCAAEHQRSERHKKVGRRHRTELNDA